MRTFEIGKRYTDGSAVFEIVSRTAKTIKFVRVQHVDRFNERKSEEKKAKIQFYQEINIYNEDYDNNYKIKLSISEY